MQDERKTKLELTREVRTLRAKLKKLEKSTDRLRQTEKALRESETAARARANELDSVMAATPSITFIARDPDCRHMTSSLAALRLLRLPVNANTSKSAPIRKRPETFRAMKDGRELQPEELPVQIAAATREWVKNFEMTLAFDDGTERDIVGDAVPLFDAEGKVRGAVGSFLDITERKRMEEQLRQAKDQYQQLVENINEVIFSLDDRGIITYVSPAVSLVGGYIPAELIGRPFSDVILPEDLKIAYGGFQNLMNGNIGPSEFRILTKSGDVRWVRSSSRPIVRDGKVVGISGSLMDITERRQAEKRLAESELKFRASFMTGLDACYISTLEEGLFVESNPAFEDLFGYSREELIGRTSLSLGLYHDPADRTKIVSDLKTKGFVKDVETKGRKKTGDVIIVSLSARTLLLGGKNHILGVLRDITERKLAEVAAKQALEWQEEIFEGSRDAIFISDQDSRFVAVNTAASDLTGYSREQLLKMRIPDIHDHSDLAAYQAFHQRIFDGEEILSEAKILRIDGGKVDTEFSNKRISIAGELYMHTTARDITERKRAVEELRKNAERLSKILEATSGGVWDWNILSGDAIFSPGYADMLGYTPGEFATAYKAWKTLVHPDDFERVNQEHSDHFHKNKKFSVAFRMREKSGNWHWVHSRGILIERDKEGNPLRMVGTHTDIQERKLAEERLIATQEQLHSLAGHLQSVREEERKHLAQEFHDQLGQTLTAVKMDLSLLLRAIADPGKEPSRSLIAQGIESSQDMIDRAIGTIREIMNELRPEMLDQLGIAPTLEWEAEWFSSHSGISCTFDTEVGEIALDPDKGIALYRIFQEAITNVARHAKATNVKVTLRKDGPNLVLEIKDNGVGIPADAEHKARSFGLISMRERAILLGGTVEIRGVEGKGTAVHVRIPVAQILADGGTTL